MKKLTPEELADKWIKEMQEMGFTPDEMLKCIQRAREIYNERYLSKMPNKLFCKILPKKNKL